MERVTSAWTSNRLYRNHGTKVSTAGPTNRFDPSVSKQAAERGESKLTVPATVRRESLSRTKPPQFRFCDSPQRTELHRCKFHRDGTLSSPRNLT